MKLNLTMMNQKNDPLSMGELIEIKGGCDCEEYLAMALSLCSDFCSYGGNTPEVYYSEKTYFVGVPEN